MSDQDRTEGKGSKRGRARGALSDAKSAVKDAYKSPRKSVKSGYRATARRAVDARDGVSSGLDGNPIAALAGGIAIGAVLGALLPRSRREAELLGGVGAALNRTASAAAAAAREAGNAKLGELGLNTDAAREGVASLLGKGAEVAKSAGAAAGKTVTAEVKSEGKTAKRSSATGGAGGGRTGGTSVLGDDPATTNFYEGDVAGTTPR